MIWFVAVYSFMAGITAHIAWADTYGVGWIRLPLALVLCALWPAFWGWAVLRLAFGFEGSEWSSGCRRCGKRLRAPAQWVLHVKLLWHLWHSPACRIDPFAVTLGWWLLGRIGIRRRRLAVAKAPHSRAPRGDE